MSEGDGALVPSLAVAELDWLARVLRPAHDKLRAEMAERKRQREGRR